MLQTNKMTDAQLRQLYFDIALHYADCLARRPVMSIEQIYNELYNSVYSSLENLLSTSTLRVLEPAEKSKAYTVLNTFLCACPLYAVEPPSDPLTFFYHDIAPREFIDNIARPYYCSNSDFRFVWMLLHDLNQPYHRNCAYIEQPQKKDNLSAALPIVIVVALFAATLAISFVALYYLLIEALNSAERFFYNEGWLQAGVALMGMAAGAILSALLSGALVAVLALNPISIIIFSVACLSIIGAAAGCFITQVIHNHFIKKANADAIDPVDPLRFALTATEGDSLVSKGIDPIKVKCAIVALRGQIGENRVPPLIRFFDYPARGKEIKDSLDKVRKLRRGDISEVTIGEMHFNCMQDQFNNQIKVGEVGIITNCAT